MDPQPLPFSLRQMQYALAVAEARHFRRAAERCAVAQPSLSSQIAAMEEALGLELFERGPGGVKVTPGGERLLERMRRILAEAGELAREAASLKDPFRGPMRLGIIPTLAPYLLPFLVPALKRAFPDLIPMWTEERTDALVAGLQRGELEGAVLAQEANLGNLAQHALGQDPFLLCLPPQHRLARSTAPLRVEKLGGEHLLLLEDGHCLRDQAMAACGEARVEELGFRATSLPTLVQMVASGAGITLLPRLAAATESARAAVTLRPLAKPAPFRTVVLAWRPCSYAAAVLARIGAVAEMAFRAHRPDLSSGM